MLVIAAGGLVDLQDPGGPGPRFSGAWIDADPRDQLSVVVRLFAELSSGERVEARRAGMGLGLHRRGADAIWKRYVGPPPLPDDPVEREAFLDGYRVRSRDIQDGIDQMLGRDPEQHRPPRLSWTTLIDRLAEDNLVITEDELIELPFRCEFSTRLQAELDT